VRKEIDNFDTGDGRTPGGLVVEVNDGTAEYNELNYPYR